MSPSIVSSVLSFLFTSSILISISLPSNIAGTPSSPSLIQFVCTNSTRTDLCLRVLESMPKVVAAKDLFNLSVAIIESGISYSSKTRSYVETALKQTSVKPGEKASLQGCKDAYDQVVMLFTDALAAVNDFDYLDPTTDLVWASTCIRDCYTSLDAGNVTDAIISRANQVVPILEFSANSALNELDRRSTSSPAPSASPSTD